MVGAAKIRPSRAGPRFGGAIVFVDMSRLAKGEHRQEARSFEHCELAPAVLQAELRIL
jgi:hypothetical protein